MKKLLVSVFAVVATAILIGCGIEASAAREPMFVEAYEGHFFTVVYHSETKVMYAVSDGNGNRGTLTLLVNPDGSPMVWDGE